MDGLSQEDLHVVFKVVQKQLEPLWKQIAQLKAEIRMAVSQQTQQVSPSDSSDWLCSPWGVFTPKGRVLPATIRQREGDCRGAFHKHYFHYRYKFEECEVKSVNIYLAT